MRAYESNISGPSPVGFSNKGGQPFFWRVLDVWCEDRELSFAVFFFFFLTWVSTPKKMVRSFISDNTFLSGWVFILLCVVDLFLCSPLLWTADNVVHGNVFHTFLQSLVAGSGA